MWVWSFETLSNSNEQTPPLLGPQKVHLQMSTNIFSECCFMAQGSFCSMNLALFPRLVSAPRAPWAPCAQLDLPGPKRPPRSSSWSSKWSKGKSRVECLTILMAISQTRIGSQILKGLFSKRRFSRSSRQGPSEENRQVANNAFLMLKPHANTEMARKFVEQLLPRRGIRIVESGTIHANEIKAQSLIDRHYGNVAMKALKEDPRNIEISLIAQQRFMKAFGMTWKTAKSKDLVCNAKQALERLGWTSKELGSRWDSLVLGSGKVKFGGGFYCGSLNGLYVINGFYMAMRAKFLLPRSSVCWYNLSWQSSQLSWKQFREEILGNTDPAVAAEQHSASIRGHFFEKWQDFGLPAPPHVGENVAHGSASPLEAMFERRTWLGMETGDPFGELLKARGISEHLMKTWQQNPTVEIDGRTGPIFDQVENKDADACLGSLQRLAERLTWNRRSEKSWSHEESVERNTSLLLASSFSFFRKKSQSAFQPKYMLPVHRAARCFLQQLSQADDGPAVSKVRMSSGVEVLWRAAKSRKGYQSLKASNTSRGVQIFSCCFAFVLSSELISFGSWF